MKYKIVYKDEVLKEDILLCDLDEVYDSYPEEFVIEVYGYKRKVKKSDL